jgi:hypothetical protein
LQTDLPFGSHSVKVNPLLLESPPTPRKEIPVNTRDRIDQPRRPDRDQEARIEALKRQAQEAAGGNMVYGQSGDLDGSVLEAFWERIVAVEKARE